MNILFPIGSFFPSQSGGPSNTIYWLAKALHDKGHHIVVGTTNEGIHDPSVQFNTWMQRDSGKVLFQKTAFHYFPLKLFLKIIPEIKKADIVHLTSLFYPLSWMTVAWIGLFQKKKKIVWSVRGELHDQAYSFSTWKKKIVFFLIKNFLSKNITFHATSDEEIKAIVNKLGKNVAIVQLPNFMLLPTKLNGATSKTILFLGRIHPIKGLENLIEAYAQIENKNGFRLVIAGDDHNSYAAGLKQQCLDLNIENEVSFIGHVEGLEKEKLLGNAHVVVLPSHTENFGNVVVEALAHGTPVIASKNTPWQLLNEVRQNSWVSNDVSSLRSVLDSMIHCNPSEYLDVRQKAYKLCSEKFSISQNISKWEDVYAGILQNSKSLSHY